MKSATVSELKNHLSKFLRWVKQGEPVVVLDRGIPVAEIHPRQKKNSLSSDRLNQLEAKGVLRRGDVGKLKEFPFPPEAKKTGALEALLQERVTSR